MIFSKIPSILSQAYTLVPLRDDLAVLQHDPYQIQRITGPSSLAKRQEPVAYLYWDRSHGRIKAIFNLDINFTIAQILGNAGVNLAQSVLNDLRSFGAYGPRVRGTWPWALGGAEWAAQLGANWEVMFQRPHGVITVGILITIFPRFRNLSSINLVLDMLRAWFERAGYYTIAVRVQNAARAGEIGSRLREGRSITERQIVGSRSDSKFCSSPIQNWIFVVTPGKLDGLLPPLITC